MKTWRIAEAGNNLEEIIERTSYEGAQLVVQNGKPLVVLLSPEEYKKSFLLSKAVP